MDDDLRVALITEVFPEKNDRPRLEARLEEARREGAQVAVLPELPLNRWAPATREVAAEDAEPPGGWRSTTLASVASTIGLGVIGGAIIRDPKTNQRFNTALVYDKTGKLVANYRKLHVPEEEGFWERSHYGEGSEPPRPIRDFSMALGIQICSDAQRPMLAHALAAAGARAILVPRATPPASYDRWRTVFRASSITTGTYTLSVNRPSPAGGDPKLSSGGPSVLVAPDGEVTVETTAPVTCVTLEEKRVREVQNRYPVYLAVRSEVYAEAWGSLPSRPGGEGE